MSAGERGDAKLRGVIEGNARAAVNTRKRIHEWLDQLGAEPHADYEVRFASIVGFRAQLATADAARDGAVREHGEYRSKVMRGVLLLRTGIDDFRHDRSRGANTDVALARLLDAAEHLWALHTVQEVECEECEGSGEADAALNGQSCSVCHGTGMVAARVFIFISAVADIVSTDIQSRLRAAISETGGSLGVLLRDALREVERLRRQLAIAEAARDGADRALRLAKWCGAIDETTDEACGLREGHDGPHIRVDDVVEAMERTPLRLVRDERGTE